MNYWRNEKSWSYLPKHRIWPSFLCSRRQAELIMVMEELVSDICTLRGLASQALASHQRQELHSCRWCIRKGRTNLYQSWTLWQRWQQQNINQGNRKLHSITFNSVLPRPAAYTVLASFWFLFFSLTSMQSSNFTSPSTVKMGFVF